MISFREGLQLDLRNIKVHNPFVDFIKLKTTISNNNNTTVTTNNNEVNDTLLSQSNQFIYFRHNPRHSSKDFLLKIGLKALLILDNDDEYINKPFISQVGLIVQEKKYKERHIREDSLDLIPQNIYSISSNDILNGFCSICLDSLNDGDTFRTLKCTHLFHKDIWLVGLDTNQSIITNVCPCCKVDPLSGSNDSSEISSRSFIQLGINLSTNNEDNSMDEIIDNHILNERLFFSISSSDSEENDHYSEEDRSWMMIN